MNVLLTGSTGYVGRLVCEALIKKGAVLLELVRSMAVSESLFGSASRRLSVQLGQQDLTSEVERFRPDVVLHLAAHLTPNDEYDDLQLLLDSNVSLTCRLLDSIKRVPPALFVNTTTFAMRRSGEGVTSPAYLYAASKEAAQVFVEFYSRVYDFPFVEIMPYTIYGRNEGRPKVFDKIIGSLWASNPVTLSPGHQILDFIHVDDIVDLYLKLVFDKEASWHSIVEAGTGVGHSLREVAALIENLSGKSTNIRWTGGYRQTEVMEAVASRSPDLRWSPSITLHDGVRRELARYQSK